MSDMMLLWGERSLPLAVGLLLQTTAIAILGLIAGRLIRLRGPGGESAVYRATLAAILVAIAWNTLAAGRFHSPVSVTDRVVFAVRPIAESGNLPAVPVTMVNGSAGNVPLVKATVSTSSVAPVSHGSDLPAQAALTGQNSEATGPEFPLPRGLVCLAAWGFVALVLIGRQIMGHFALARLARTSTPISSGHALDLLEDMMSGDSAPVLRAHAHVAAPFLAGVRHPVIYLPADYATQYDHDTLRAILAHELEHVARRDCAWFVLAHVTTSLFWPHPLVWMLERRLSQASEEACDAAVLAHGCPAGAYAASLLALAERMGRAKEPAFGVGISPVRSSVGRRIKRILDRTRTTAAHLPKAALVIIALGAIVSAAVAVPLFCPSFPGHPLTPSTATPTTWTIPAQTSTTPPDYARHFTLATRNRWDMASIQGVSEVGGAQASTINGRLRIPVEDIAAMKGCVPFDLVKTRNYGLTPPPISIRTRLEKVLAKRPHFFFAEYRLAEWYVLNRQMKPYNVWRARALADAPAILAGRVQYEDGHPITGLGIAPTIRYNNTNNLYDTSWQQVDYHCAFTDNDGCFYIPVYPGLYEISGYGVYSAWGAGRTISKFGNISLNTPHRFESDKRVGLLPPAILNPWIQFTGPLAVRSYPEKPLRLQGSSLPVAWKTPLVQVTRYEMSLTEMAAGGKAERTLWTGNIKPTNFTLDLDGKKPEFMPGHIYRMRLLARYGDLELGESLPVYFTPESGGRAG